MTLLDKLRVLLHRAFSPMKPGEWRYQGKGVWIVCRRGGAAQILEAALRRCDCYSPIRVELLAPGRWKVRFGFYGGKLDADL